MSLTAQTLLVFFVFVFSMNTNGRFKKFGSLQRRGGSQDKLKIMKVFFKVLLLFFGCYLVVIMILTLFGDLGQAKSSPETLTFFIIFLKCEFDVGRINQMTSNTYLV